MSTIDRPGDLTVRICADCGRPIIGKFVRIEIGGVSRYFHPGRCERVSQIREHTGIVRPLRISARESRSAIARR